MPVDKNKILRYKIIDTCLRDMSKCYKVEDLLGCVNTELQRHDLRPISKRTIQLDLKTLQEEPFNVELDEQLFSYHFYRYADANCKVELYDLLPADRDALEKTISVLRQYVSDTEGQSPQYQWMLTAMQTVAGGRELSHVEQYISFENNNAFAGNAHFSLLLESIINKQPLHVRYRPYGKEATMLNVHPYHLKQFNSRWFLLCAVQDREEAVSNLALDRILYIKPWKHEFMATEIDFTTWFCDIVGVSRNDNMPLEQIVLKVNNRRYPYIETKPFSERQRIIAHDSETHTIIFPIRVNNELVSELLSFGADVEIMQPKHLRDRIATTASQLATIYSDAQKPCTSKL